MSDIFFYKNFTSVLYPFAFFCEVFTEANLSRIMYIYMNK